MIPARKRQVQSTRLEGQKDKMGHLTAQPAFAKYTGEKQSLPQKPFDNIWASRTIIFPWIIVRSKKGVQVKKKKKVLGNPNFLFAHLFFQ